MHDLFHQQYVKNHLLNLLLWNEIMLAIDLLLVKMIMALAKALHNIFDISQSVPATVPSCQLSRKKSTTLWRVSNSRTDGVGGMGGSPSITNQEIGEGGWMI